MYLQSEGAHGVPGRQHHRFLLEHVQHVLRDKLFVHDNFVHELVEPALGHQQIALLATVVAPRVFYAPFQRFAINLKKRFHKYLI